ncbi:HlyU family transcriptional regulator [Rhizobiaceae bacterium BDR2-2]|uniref:HlyU family transcriptional regulator n=1 Tax=Ectorhizobium quercum TaxID=2965071 RepID=A0AAE3N3I1_9HYPH|nr:HlyU family transcriptional regulator [Ectorhizobium quercum]MCX8997847.1 HlyU family transcriptional regulator [Ectorhizobium quercum]
MPSIFSKLLSVFSGGSAPAAPAKEREPREHEGLRVFATPIREGSQFRLAGRIEKDVDGETLRRDFIRADIFTSEDDAVEFTFRKAEQIIQQNRASLFADAVKTGNV